MNLSGVFVPIIASIIGVNLSNQESVYLMIVLTIVLGLISGILAYFALNMPHAQHGHDDEDHH